MGICAGVLIGITATLGILALYYFWAAYQFWRKS